MEKSEGFAIQQTIDKLLNILISWKYEIDCRTSRFTVNFRNWKVWLCVLIIMSHTRFRVNLHSVIVRMSSNVLRETGAIYQNMRDIWS